MTLARPDGWSTIGTGGNCTAWHRSIPGRRHALITNGDASAPTRDGGLVVAVYYDDVEIAGGEAIAESGGDLEQCLAWLAWIVSYA